LRLSFASHAAPSHDPEQKGGERWWWRDLQDLGVGGGAIHSIGTLRIVDGRISHNTAGAALLNGEPVDGTRDVSMAR